jgi:hypothetical protein
MTTSDELSKDKPEDKSNSEQETGKTEQETTSKVRHPPQRGRTFGAPGSEKRG